MSASTSDPAGAADATREPWGARRYGDPCVECGFDWQHSVFDAIDSVRRAPDALDRLLREGDGPRRRPTGGWSVTEYVGHIGDNLRQWAERVQGARLAGALDVAGYDPDALASARGYADIALPAAQWSFQLAAHHWASVVWAAHAESIELMHATRGLQRAEDVARNNAHDVQHHLWDVAEILSSSELGGER